MPNPSHNPSPTPSVPLADRLVAAVFLPLMTMLFVTCFASFSSNGLSDVLKRLQSLADWQYAVIAATFTVLAWLGFYIGRDTAFAIHSSSDSKAQVGNAPWLNMGLVRVIFFGSTLAIVAVFMLPLAVK